MKKLSKVLLTSLMAVPMFSVSAVSAAETVTDQLPDTVTRKAEHVFEHDSGITGGRIWRSLSSDDKYILYCSNRNNDFVANDVLTKDEKMPYGIAYILKNSYPTKKLISGITAEDSIQHTATFCDKGEEMINIYITQASIWTYQKTISNETRISNQLQFKDNENTGSCDSYTYNGVTYNTIGGTPVTEFSNLLWNTYINNLVAGANSVQDPANTSLNISNVSNWSEENDTYKSDLISVTLSNSEATNNTYNLSLADAPNGTKIFTESGSDITENASSIDKNTKVYITVPKKEVSSGKANFTLNATSDITYDAAYKYVDKTNGHQPSVLVGPEQKQVLGSLSLTIVPDTASMISKSIYFIGFIILLSGAGIIYANVRPRKVEE